MERLLPFSGLGGPIHESGPLTRVRQQTAVDGSYSGETARGNVSARPLLLRDFRGTPSHRAIEFVQKSEPDRRQGVGRRRSARTGVSGRVPMDARMVQDSR
jgi:hypothetical protein